MENEFTIPETAETKSAPFALFAKANIKGERTRAGIFAVLGNRDNAGDRTQPGAFAKTWKEGKKNIVHLWDHGKSDLAIPTASIDDLYEISKADLPDEVLEQAPDATGAAVVVRTYVKSQWGDHFLAAVDSGAIKQMSFAYAIPKGKDEMIQEMVKGERVSTRLLKEVKQYDTSDVRWGCNGATIAQIKSLFQRKNPDLAALVKSLIELETEIKAGARNSASDAAMVQQIHDLCQSLHPACCVAEKANPESDEAAQSKQFAFSLAFAKLKSLHANTQPSR